MKNVHAVEYSFENVNFVSDYMISLT